jgi:2-dehydro-3-deoxygluconokinase
LGLYFFERATSPRASHIIYDRHGSAFVREPDPEHSWSDLLSADTFLVVTGITAALGPSPRRVVGEAIEAAASLGSAVAVDLNYRASLWSIDEAFSWLSDHMPRIDVLSAAPSDVDQLGITSENRYQSAVAKFGLSAVIGASKEVKGRTAHITVTAATPEECVTGAAEAEIRDPVGTGDAMFGTFLACLNRMPLQQTVEKSVGAVVTAYGLDGDVLTSDPWTAEEMGAVRR